MFVIFSFVFFNQKTAYEMRISDWSSDVCSSDLSGRAGKACGKPCGGVVSHDSRYLHQPNRYAAHWELGTTEATTHKQERMSAKDAKGAKKAKQVMGFPLRTLRVLRTICFSPVPSP